MPTGRLDAETSLKTAEPLAGQGNFGNGYYHLFAIIQSFGYGLKIDLGFAGTRYAVKQRYREPLADFADQNIGGGLLFGS